MKIGSLLSAMQEYLQTALVNDQEVRVSDLAVKIQKPCGQYTTINYIIKKNSPGVKLFFGNNNTLTCASKHILYDQSQLARYACNFAVGDRVLTQNGYLTVVSVQQVPSQDFYDIGIDAPHVYCDSAGILHHNTMITAALSQRCEPHGRTIVIVPNKSLVTQTERDYQLLGLDVGVWFGDRKEADHQHVICTWQSLNILLKNARNQIGAEAQGLVTIDQFIQGVVAVIVDECFAGHSRVLTPAGWVPIKDILPGDQVINYDEELEQFKIDTVVKQHQNLSNSSTEKMYRMEFDNNTVIEVTGNHKFLTQKGWIRADELTEEHEILSHGINT